MYEQQIKLKLGSPSSWFAKRRISPALSSHARLIKLLLNSWWLVLVFRPGKSIVLPTMHCKWGCKLNVDWSCFLLADRCQSSAAPKFFFSLIFISWVIIEIQNSPHRRLEIDGWFWTGRFWPILFNLPHTSWRQPLLVKHLYVTRTWNSGVKLRNQSNCWPH